MEQQAINLLFAAAAAALFWVGLFLIPGYLIRRAVFQVISIFKEKNSLCSQAPKTADQLGLSSPNLLQRLTKPKDYKPYALQGLIKADIVRITEGGKLCLREEKLNENLEGGPQGS